ncbi:DUF2283 domain-containing protein [Corynebacterium sp. L4756]|uniref:DUF2283 domain-containing protein n=1 Tax=unclassified Corynebacterium TaxID=2624378 RepID=UPI00374D9ACE
MNKYQSVPLGVSFLGGEGAYIELNDNEVAYSLSIGEHVIADMDEDAWLVGLELLSLKHIPSFEDIDSEVYIDDWNDIDLEEVLYELDSYNRIQRYFGTSDLGAI